VAHLQVKRVTQVRQQAAVAVLKVRVVLVAGQLQMVPHKLVVLLVVSIPVAVAVVILAAVVVVTTALVVVVVVVL
tara:strand:- start:324 stop:548 length:225 start_codon:yes stop_codon:yes gene_type:complete